MRDSAVAAAAASGADIDEMTMPDDSDLAAAGIVLGWVCVCAANHPNHLPTTPAAAGIVLGCVWVGVSSSSGGVYGCVTAPLLFGCSSVWL